MDGAIKQIVPKLKDKDVATLFSNCLPNTVRAGHQRIRWAVARAHAAHPQLDTTVYSSDPTNTFVITGDIDAMWQRDSCNQVLPYLRFATHDKALAALLRGLVGRQATNLLADPFANAFKFSETSMPSPHVSDSTSKPRLVPPRRHRHRCPAPYRPLPSPTASWARGWAA